MELLDHHLPIGPGVFCSKRSNFPTKMGELRSLSSHLRAVSWLLF